MLTAARRPRGSATIAANPAMSRLRAHPHVLYQLNSATAVEVLGTSKQTAPPFVFRV
jgi:hypothetical protein